MTASGEPRLGAGAAVEVRNHFQGTWAGGFYVTEACAEGYRVARGDGTALPVCVDPADVRSAPTRAAAPDPGQLLASISLDLRHADATVTIRVNGPLTRSTASQFHQMTREVGGPRVVVDLSSVSTIDEPGAAVLLALIHRCREDHGTVLVAATHPVVRRVLQQVGVHRVAALIDGPATPRVTPAVEAGADR